MLDQLIVDPTPTDEAKPFGWSLDMEGDFLAIGAPGGLGAVSVFEHNGTVWAERESLAGDPADNLVNDLEFGYDVAISTDGDVLVVGMTGYDYVGCDDCGAVRVFDWDAGGTQYVDRDIIEDGNTWNGTGHTLDLDEVPGSADMRLVLGNFSDSLGLYNIIDGLGAAVTQEGFFDVPSGWRESVAIDADRIVAVGLSGASDAVLVIDRNNDTEWVAREIYSGVLFEGAGTLPNNHVDVSGDTIVVGVEDAAGGDVSVFFNDPAFGWGIADPTLGWTDGPTNEIVPTFQAASLRIARAVAVDGAGATKSIVFGADGADSNGVDAGTVYAKSISDIGTAQPANKLTPVDFNDSFKAANFGAIIEMGTTPFGPTAVVAEPGGQAVHRLEPSGAEWAIVQTIDYFEDVIDIDLRESDGAMVVLLRNGDVLQYQEDTCGGANCSFSQVGAAFDVQTTITGSVEISEISDDVLVAKVNGTGDQFQQLIDFGNGGNGPVGPPAGVVPADLFGASADTEGRYTFIGAPGTDTGLGANTGRVYVWDNQNSTFALTIDGQVAGAKFGSSVAIDNNKLVIGAEDDGVSFDGLALRL